MAFNAKEALIKLFYVKFQLLAFGMDVFVCKIIKQNWKFAKIFNGYESTYE